jgi:hypothetical protein
LGINGWALGMMDALGRPEPNQRNRKDDASLLSGEVNLPITYGHGPPCIRRCRPAGTHFSPGPAGIYPTCRGAEAAVHFSRGNHCQTSFFLFFVKAPTLKATILGSLTIIKADLSVTLPLAEVFAAVAQSGCHFWAALGKEVLGIANPHPTVRPGS